MVKHIKFTTHVVAFIPLLFSMWLPLLDFNSTSLGLCDVMWCVHQLEQPES